MKKSPQKIINICANYPILCTVVAALCWFAFSAFEMFNGANEFYFLDTDCYTRYLRITDWLSGDFSWFEKIFPFTNCPNGEILHFTRINDILWLVFSLPFFLFLPMKEAVFAGGMIFSPILFIITLSIIMCGLKKYIGEKNFAKPSLFIFAFSFVFLLKTMIFGFGRPDHHSLMLLIAAFLSINLLTPTNKKMFFGGMAAAIGIWASSAFEGMLLAYVVLAILCVGIIFYKHSFEYAFYYTFGLFLGTLSSYILNPPFEGYLYFDNARLSVIHVVICGLTFVVFTFCRYLNPHKNIAKIGFISIGALLSFAVLLAIFGINTIFAPIYDEKIIKYFVPYISEMKPILAQESCYFVIGSLEALFLYRFFKRKKFADTAIYILFFSYLPIAAFIRRFLSYEILFFVLINALMLAELFKKISKNEKYKWATLICIALNLTSALSFNYAVSPTYASYPKLNGCALTDIFFTPQLIYKTGITTVGSPYHRNIEGIVTSIEIFSMNDENQIKNILAEHNIKYVILPEYDLSYLENLPENSFYKSLKNDKKYDWLKLLNNKDETFLFYEVIR